METEIDRCSNLEALLEILFYHLGNWISYNFLINIVDFCKNKFPDVAEHLSEYRQSLQPLLMGEVADIKQLHLTESERGCAVPKGLVRIKAILRCPMRTTSILVQDLLDARNFLARSLVVPEDILVLIGWCKMLFAIVLWAPAEVEALLLKRLKTSQEVLHDYGFVSITVGDNRPVVLQALPWVRTTASCPTAIVSPFN